MLQTLVDHHRFFLSQGPVYARENAGTTSLPVSLQAQAPVFPRLAASLLRLRSPADNDNQLVQRVRAA